MVANLVHRVASRILAAAGRLYLKHGDVPHRGGPRMPVGESARQLNRADGHRAGQDQTLRSVAGYYTTIELALAGIRLLLSRMSTTR